MSATKRSILIELTDEEDMKKYDEYVSKLVRKNKVYTVMGYNQKIFTDGITTELNKFNKSKKD